MKQRILVAVIGIPLLLLVLCWAPHWGTAALLAVLSLIGAHELLAAVSALAALIVLIVNAKKAHKPEDMFVNRKKHENESPKEGE